MNRLSIPATAALLLIMGAAAQATTAPAVQRRPGGGLAVPAALSAARLGMSLGEWKALPFPGAPDARVQPVCSNDPGAGRGDFLALSASDRRAGAVVCGYAARYGTFALSEALPLDQRYLATRVRYVFVGGRLAQIRYRASRDAFDDLIAILKSAYGPPRATQRDTMKTSMGRLDRVQMTWSAPTSRAVLTDPADSALDIGVQVSAAKP